MQRNSCGKERPRTDMTGGGAGTGTETGTGTRWDLEFRAGVQGASRKVGRYLR